MSTMCKHRFEWIGSISGMVRFNLFEFPWNMHNIWQISLVAQLAMATVALDYYWPVVGHIFELHKDRKITLTKNKLASVVGSFFGWLNGLSHKE